MEGEFGERSAFQFRILTDFYLVPKSHDSRARSTLTTGINRVGRRRDSAFNKLQFANRLPYTAVRRDREANYPHKVEAKARKPRVSVQCTIYPSEYRWID